MNRQTLLVTVATLALVVVGAVLLYAAPGSDPGHKPAGNAAAKVEKAGKAGKGDKAKAAAAPNKVPVAELIHAPGLPADRVAAPAGAPNVVLVVMSTQRRDQWSMYGGPPEVTPFLAARAAAGVKFDDALSVAVDPHASTSALVTGRFPHHLGVLNLGEKRANPPIAAEADTLAERFAAGGWFTVGLTANHVLNEKAGGAQGFDWFRDAQQFSLMLELRTSASELVDATLERVAARTEAEKARPMFLQLAFVDSHKPIKIPPDEFKPFAGENGEVAPYRASIRRQDDALAKLVSGLAAQGLTDANTVFVVIADHGEGLEMPTHHRKQHGFVLYHSAVQIPWVMWGKDVAAGKSVEGLASQIDLAPTLLALAGSPSGVEGVDGVDLSKVVKSGGATGRAEAYADTTYEGVHRASMWTAAHQCQKDFGSRDIGEDQFSDGCFDRKADPDFTQVIQDEPLMNKLAQMHTELMAGVAGAEPATAGE